MKESATKALCVFLASCAVATAQTSLSTSEPGCGGRQSASTYVINGEAGFGGLSSVSPTTVKSGFAGQLYDVTSFTVSSDSSTTLIENASYTFSTIAGLDDGSALAVDTNSVAWSSGGNPLQFYSPGIYFTLPVYQDTATAVTGAYAGIESVVGLTVQNNDPDNFPTAPYNFAFDGIPDSWQMTNFPAGSSNAAPTADSDGDGSTTMAEYFFNTDPNDAASTPADSVHPEIVIVSNQPFFAATIFHRTDLPTIEFAPQIVSNLTTTAWTSTPVLVSQATNDAGMVTDTWRDVVTATNSSPRFLRVQISESED